MITTPLLLAALAAAAADPPPALDLKHLRVAGAFGDPEVEPHYGDSHFGAASLRMWSVNDGAGLWSRVVEIVPERRPRGLAGYVGHWRSGHGCTAREVRDLPPSKRTGSAPPPQVTFEGSCEGGDAYITRVLVVGAVVYELHVDRRIGASRGSLPDAMKALLARVELKAP